MPLTDSITGAADIAFLYVKTAPGTEPGAASGVLDQPDSLAQSRRVIFFSDAYFSAEERIIGLRMLLSA